MRGLFAVVFGLAALIALILGIRQSRKFLLPFFAFFFSLSFLLVPGWLGLEDHLVMLGQGLSLWAAAFFALAGLAALFREVLRREEKVIVEAAPLAEFFVSLKDFLAHPFTLVEIFNLCLREICRLWGLPAGAVFVYNPSTDELLLAVSAGLSREQEKRWEKIRAKEELFSRSARTGVSVAIGDLSHSRKSWAGLAPFVNFGSLVSIPLTGRERVLGVLVLLAERPYRFGKGEEIELAPVGLALGMFADGVRILRETRKRTDEAAFFKSDLEKTLVEFSSLQKGDALHNLLDAAAKRLPYQLGLVLSKQGERWQVASSSFEPAVGEVLKNPLAETVADICKTSEARKLPDLNKLPGLFETDLELPPVSNAIVVPLWDDKKPVGAFFFGFESDHQAGEYELLHLSGLSGIAALLLSRPAEAHPAENWVGALQTLASVKSEDELRSFLDFALVTFFHFDSGFLFALEEDGLRLAKNWGGPALAPFEISFDEGVWGRITADKTPLSLHSKEAKELMQSLGKGAAEQVLKASGGIGFPVSQIAAPIFNRDEIWGALSLERYRHSFTAAEFEKFAALAHLISLKLSALNRGELALEEGVEVGNELNNDLTAILGNLELVSAELPQGSPLREKLEELVRLTQKAGDKVGQLARNLSSLAGAEKDINRLLNEVAEEEGSNLTADLSPLPEVRIDALKFKGFLREVIQELMQKGEGTALSLKTDTDNQYVYIRLIARTEESHSRPGEALSGQNFGQMFRSDFSRLEESLTPSDLTWITEAGGQVSLVEDQHAGRSLTLRFPIPKTPKKGWKKSLKILAVDDQQIIRDLLVNMFGSAGHEVTTADRGEEGIAKFKIQRFDLVVTDLSMPDLSGWEVAREVKKMRPEVPVILITGWGQNFDEQKLSEAGVDRVVTKPFRIEQLMKTVEELLAKTVAR